MKRSSKVLVAAIAVCLVLSSLAVDEGATLAPTSGPKSACKPGFEYNRVQNKCLEYDVKFEVAKCLRPTQLGKANVCFYEAMKCDDEHGEKEVQVINPLTQLSETKCEMIEKRNDASKCDEVRGWTPTTVECTKKFDRGAATLGCPTEYPDEVDHICRHRVDLISEGLAIGQQPYCADPDKYSVYRGFCQSKKMGVKVWKCGTAGLKPIDGRCYEEVTRPFGNYCLKPGYELSGTNCLLKSRLKTFLRCYQGTQNDTTGDCDNKVEVYPTKGCPPGSTYEEEAEEDMATNTNTPAEEYEVFEGELEEVCRYVKTDDDPSCDGGAWDQNGMCP